MTSRLLFGALNFQNIPSGGGNMETVSGAAYAIPVQKYQAAGPVTETVTIPNQDNHAHTIFDSGEFNFTGSTDSNAVLFNSQGTLNLIGSGTLSGGLRTRTDSIDQASEENFAGYSGLTANRDARNTGNQDVTFARTGTGSDPNVEGVAIVVAQDGSDFGGAIGSLTERASSGGSNTRGTASQFRLDYTVNAADRVITAEGSGSRPQGGEDPDEQVGSLDTNVQTFNNASITRAWFRGPAYQTGDENSIPASTRGTAGSPQLTAGQTFTAITGTSQIGTYSLRISSSRGASRPLYDISFQNNNSYALNLAAASTGGARELPANQSSPVEVQTRLPNQDWNLTSTAGFDGTTSGTGGITATVTSGGSDFGGALGNPTSRGAPPYTIDGGDSVIEVAATHPSGASDEPVSATFQVTRSGSVVGGPFSINNGGSGPVSGFLRGPAYQSGDETTFQSQNRRSTTLWQVGDVVEVTAQQGNVRIVTRRRAQRTLYDITFTNTNSFDVNLDSNSTGGARTLQRAGVAGSSVEVQSDEPSSSFRISASSVTIPAYDDGSTQTTTRTVRGVTATVGTYSHANGAITSASNNSWESYSANQTMFTADGRNNSNAGATTGTITFTEPVTITGFADYFFDNVSSDRNAQPLLGETHVIIGGQALWDARASLTRTRPRNSGFATVYTIPTTGFYRISWGFDADNPDRDNGDFTGGRIIPAPSGTSGDFGGSWQNGGAGAAFAGQLTAGTQIQAASDGGATTITISPEVTLARGVGSISLPAGTHSMSFRNGPGGNNSNPAIDFTLTYSGGGRVTYNSFGGANYGAVSRPQVVFSNSNSYPLTLRSTVTLPTEARGQVIPTSGSLTYREENSYRLAWDSQAPQVTVNDFSLTNNTGKVIHLNSITGTSIQNGATATVLGGATSQTTSTSVTLVQRQDAIGGTGIVDTSQFTGTLVNE